MGNPILFVTNNGYGETPVPAEAILKPGDTFTIHDDNSGTKQTARIRAVVPVGTPIEVAIADQTGEARPLCMSKPRHREILYIIDYEGRRIDVPHSHMKRGLEQAEAAGLNDQKDGEGSRRA